MADPPATSASTLDEQDASALFSFHGATSRSLPYVRRASNKRSRQQPANPNPPCRRAGLRWARTSRRRGFWRSDSVDAAYSFWAEFTFASSGYTRVAAEPSRGSPALPRLAGDGDRDGHAIPLLSSSFRVLPAARAWFATPKLNRISAAILRVYGSLACSTPAVSAWRFALATHFHPQRAMRSTGIALSRRQPRRAATITGAVRCRGIQ